MSSKTRKVTEVGRLVTRGQLQSVVNQIGAQLAAAIEKSIAQALEEHERTYHAAIVPTPEQVRKLMLHDSDAPAVSGPKTLDADSATGNKADTDSEATA